MDVVFDADERRTSSVGPIAIVALVIAMAAFGALGVTGRIPGLEGCGLLDRALCARVLFVGNSYTAANDLPHTFANIARAAGRRVETATIAPGGATLTEHVQTPSTMAELSKPGWTDVVLQEQSQLASVKAVREAQMYPAARSLALQVQSAGATPVLLMTWARRDGWPEQGLPDFAGMERGIEEGYLELAGQLAVPVAPVGVAWRTVRSVDPSIVLWQADGSHPTVAGTYLAACVVYATIFGVSPVGSGERAGLEPGVATILQSAAAGAVLKGANP